MGFSHASSSRKSKQNNRLSDVLLCVTFCHFESNQLFIIKNLIYCCARVWMRKTCVLIEILGQEWHSLMPHKQKDVFEDVYFTTSPWTRLQLRDRVSDVRKSALTAADFRRSRLNYTFLVVNFVTLFQHCAWCMKCCVIVDLWVDVFMCLFGRLFVCVWCLTCATTSGAHAVLPVSCRLRLVWVVWIDHFRECFYNRRWMSFGCSSSCTWGVLLDVQKVAPFNATLLLT